MAGEVCLSTDLTGWTIVTTRKKAFGFNILSSSDFKLRFILFLVQCDRRNYLSWASLRCENDKALFASRCCCSKGNSPRFEILTLGLMKVPVQDFVVGRIAAPGVSKDRTAFVFRSVWLTLKAAQSLETSGITRPTNYFWRLHTKCCWCISLVRTLRRLL
jgi:hypothetical protein